MVFNKINIKISRQTNINRPDRHCRNGQCDDRIWRETVKNIPCDWTNNWQVLKENDPNNSHRTRLMQTTGINPNSLSLCYVYTNVLRNLHALTRCTDNTNDLFIWTSAELTFISTNKYVCELMLHSCLYRILLLKR